MATPTNFEYNLPIPASEAMQIVDSEGIIAMHNFIPTDLREYALSELNIETSTAQKQNLNRSFSFKNTGLWEMPGSSLAPAPLNIFSLAHHVSNYANRAEGVEWNPTEIFGHEYKVGEFVGNHSASMGALGHVAIATLDGLQEFHARLDDGTVASVELTAGSVLFLRGSEQTGKARPAHWVSGAKTHRTAISIK